MFFVDHLERTGKVMFAEIRARDMEGIVCKACDQSVSPGERPDNMGQGEESEVFANRGTTNCSMNGMENEDVN